MTDPQSGMAEVAGTRLYYESVGAGPALVLVHGFSGDCRMWDAQLADWSQRFRVIRYDLRGYGRSALPTQAPYAHADDLEALLDHLGIARAHVVGISMGGWIATHFAITRPARVSALVLLSSALGGWEWSPEWKALWSALRERAAEAGMAAARQLWLAHPLFAAARASATTARQLEAMVAAYSGWHWCNADPQRDIEIPDMQQLDLIAAPTLVVSGERDLEDFQLIAEVLRHAIPAAQGLQLPGVGHLLNIEAPAPLNRAVLDFLAAAPAGN